MYFSGLNFGPEHPFKVFITLFVEQKFNSSTSANDEYKITAGLAGLHCYPEEDDMKYRIKKKRRRMFIGGVYVVQYRTFWSFWRNARDFEGYDHSFSEEAEARRLVAFFDATEARRALKRAYRSSF